MSIEIWQFPQTAKKPQLVHTLKELGYVEAENLFWRGPSGTVSLFWDEPRDFKSTSGVDASVFPLDNAGKQVWKTTTDWVLRTRTSIWASSFDKEHQNHTVRTVRKRFGGSFYNDHYGHNRYNVIERVASTPASRGIYALVERLRGELESLEHALPPDGAWTLDTPRGVITEVNDKTGVLRAVKQMDPSRVLHNALVPFLVAAIEHLFRESFEILLTYDAPAQRRLEEQQRKVPYTEVAALARGELTLEGIASAWYSFQNLDSVHKAFKEVFGIDVWRLLRSRTKIRNRLPVLSEALRNLIGARHGIIHDFSLDRELDREGFLTLLELVRALVEVMANTIKSKLGVPLGPG
jgi:hypothetical protein